jgi:hypothetical protein
MPEQRAWYRVIPVLRLLAAIRLAFDARKLGVAAVGLCALQLGFWVLDLAFPESAELTPDVLRTTGHTLARIAEGDQPGYSLSGLLVQICEPVRLLTTPLGALVEPGGSWRTMAHAFLGLAWPIVVWGLCGGAIARMTVLREATLRQAGLAEGLRFAATWAGRLILTPLCPLFAGAICALIGASFGLLYRVPRVPREVVGAGLFVPLVAGLIMTLLVGYLVASWPLLHAALAAGADDALDAISRAFGYLNQRLGLVAVAGLVAGAAGILGLILVDLLAGWLIRMTGWSIALTSPVSLVGWPAAAGSQAAAGSALWTHRFWLGVVHLVAHGWIYTYFWTAAAILYLWLRQEVDGTAWTEIDLPAAHEPTGPSGSVIDAARAPDDRGQHAG